MLGVYWGFLSMSWFGFWDSLTICPRLALNLQCSSGCGPCGPPASASWVTGSQARATTLVLNRYYVYSGICSSWLLPHTAVLFSHNLYFSCTSAPGMVFRDCLSCAYWVSCPSSVAQLCSCMDALWSELPWIWSTHGWDFVLIFFPWHSGHCLDCLPFFLFFIVVGSFVFL